MSGAPVRIAIVCPLLARYDAISAAARDSYRALANDAGFEPVMLALRNDFPDLPAGIVSGVADLLLHPAFLAADAIIYHFGIYCDLFDALLTGNGRAKQIVWFHSVTPLHYAPHNQRATIERSLRQIHNLRHADETWATSEINAAALREYGIVDSRIQVIPLAVESPGFARLADKSSSPLEILFIGRFVPSKGVLDLIAAIARMRRASDARFRLRLVGNLEWSDADYVQNIERTIHHDGVGLDEIAEFCGTVDDDTRERLLHSAQILAIPSYHEGFCKPVVEALRCGAVPVGYAAYNLPAIVNGFGRMVPTGNIEALAAALAEVSDGIRRSRLPLDRGVMSLNEFDASAHEYVSQFSLARVGSMMRERLVKAFEPASECQATVNTSLPCSESRVVSAGELSERHDPSIGRSAVTDGGTTAEIPWRVDGFGVPADDSFHPSAGHLLTRPPVSAAAEGVERNAGQNFSVTSDSTCPTSLYERVGIHEYWDQFFATPDPWGYWSQFEALKREHTLRALPPGESERALELAAAEGHFTVLLADRVGTLLASDISAVALERAARRCQGKRNVVFQRLDLVRDPLPGQFDLIICSEVLYYLETTERLRTVMEKLAKALAPDGVLVMTHPNLVTDDPDETGFDWTGHRFGAKTIGEVASELASLALEWELRTPLYRTQRFRRVSSATRETPRVVALPLSTPLERSLERSIVWDGAIFTREAAQRAEETTSLSILCYHRIAEHGPEVLAPYRTHPKVFEQQVRWLRRHGYHSVSITQWVEAMQGKTPLRGRPVLFTFDDGYRDFAQLAWPILDRHGFSALVFIVTGKVGRSADWDAEFGEPAALMGWEEIRELSREGVDFGSHTASHRRLDFLTPEEVTAECVNSRAALEKNIQRAIPAISYPWSACSEDVRRLVAASGYAAAVTTSNRRARLTDDRFALPRIEIRGDCSLRNFVDSMEATEST